MGLSCSCEWGGDGWYYFPPGDFTRLTTKRARRCCSCGERIAVGAECAEFRRGRAAATDIEERICGDEVPLAPYFMCERCAGLFFALDELGFCVGLRESMIDLAKEYGEMQRESAELKKRSSRVEE